MTIIASGNVNIVDTFYVIRDESGFWESEKPVDDFARCMECVGDPMSALRFDSAENALAYLKEESGLSHGKANVAKIENTTKIEDLELPTENKNDN